MTERSYNPAFLTRYLLGDLSPSEQDSVEEDFFLDNNLFIYLLDVKDQLTSEYLGGCLSPDERERFEKRFLASPECRLEVELAYFLQQTSARQPVTTAPAQKAEHPSWWREFLKTLGSKPMLAGATAAAMLAVVATWAWFAITSQPGATQSEIATSSGTSVFTLELSSGQQRDDLNRLPRIPLASGVQTIALKLDAGTTTYPDYRAKLLRLTDDATPALTSKTLKAEKSSSGGVVILWEVPAAGLQSGDYQVKLEATTDDGGTENIGSYYFSASR